jgi:hypothetical protein
MDITSSFIFYYCLYLCLLGRDLACPEVLRGRCDERREGGLRRYYARVVCTPAPPTGLGRGHGSMVGELRVKESREGALPRLMPRGAHSARPDRPPLGEPSFPNRIRPLYRRHAPPA